METFLKEHELTKKRNFGGDYFLVEVFDQSGQHIDELFCYCLFDVLRITRYYLTPDGRFWYTVKVTKC